MHHLPPNRPSRLTAPLLVITFAALIGCGGSSSNKNNHSSSSASSISSAITSYSLTYSATTGGSISGQTTQSVVTGNAGSSVTAVADADYRFIGWSDGSFSATRTDSNIQQNTTLSANFEPAGLWSTAPYSGQMTLEVLGPRSINVVWEDNEPRTVMVSTRNDVDANVGEIAGVNWHVNVTSPFKLENLEVDQPIYVALQQDDVVAAWSSGTPKQLHTNGIIHSLELAEDGTRFLSGDFSYIGPVYSSLALLPDARVDIASPLAFPSIPGSISAIESDGQNGWYIGGHFSEVLGETRHNFVHINAQGQVSSWAPLFESEVITKIASKNDIVYIVHEPAVQFIGNSLALTAIKYNQAEPLFTYAIGSLGFYKVNALTVTDEKLYIAGSFPAINGQPRNNLAVLSLTGELLDWQPQENFSVNDIAVIDNLIFVARNDDQNSLVIYDPEGNEIPAETRITGEIKHIQADGEYIYATGTVKEPGSNENYTVVRFDKNGKLIPFDVILEANAEDTFLVHNHVLYFSAAGQTGEGLKAYSLKEKTLLSWNPGTSAGASLIAPSDKTLLTFAPSRVIGGHSRHSLASIDSNDQLLDWAPELNGEVKTTALHEGTLYIGGNFFLETEGFTRYNAAAFNIQGEITEWNPSILTVDPGLPWGPQNNPEIDTIKIRNGIIYMGGKYHTQEDNINLLRHVAAFDEQGNLLNWRPHLHSQATRVNSIALTNKYVYFVSEVRIDSDQTHQNFSIVNQTDPLDFFEPEIPDGITILSLTTEADDVYAIGYHEIDKQEHIFKFSQNRIESHWPVEQTFDCLFSRKAPPTPTSTVYKSRIFWGEKDFCYNLAGLVEHHPHNGTVRHRGMKEISALNVRNDQLIAGGVPTGIPEFLDELSANIYTYKIYDLTQPIN